MKTFYSICLFLNNEKMIHQILQINNNFFKVDESVISEVTRYYLDQIYLSVCNNLIKKFSIESNTTDYFSKFKKHCKYYFESEIIFNNFEIEYLLKKLNNYNFDNKCLFIILQKTNQNIKLYSTINFEIFDYNLFLKQLGYIFDSSDEEE